LKKDHDASGRASDALKEGPHQTHTATPCERRQVHPPSVATPPTRFLQRPLSFQRYFIRVCRAVIVLFVEWSKSKF
jgi:hypothetical protein